MKLTQLKTAALSLGLAVLAGATAGVPVVRISLAQPAVAPVVATRPSLVSTRPATLPAVRTKIAAGIESISADIFRVSPANADLLGPAIEQTIDRLGDWEDLGQGRRRLTSMKGFGRDWRDAGGKLKAVRARTEFHDRRKVLCVIESVTIAGEPTLVLLLADTMESLLALHNALAEDLRQQVTQRETQLRQKAIEDIGDLVVRILLRDVR